LGFTNNTHTNRWELANSYSEGWKTRAVQLMDLFKTHEFVENSKYQLVEYGCGAHAPFHTLYNGEDGFGVTKYDIKAWDEQTSVIDLNSEKAAMPTTNISAFSGVLEYLDDVPLVLRKAINASDYLLVSYAFVHSALLLNDGKYLTSINQRAVKNGWRNHYTNKDLVELLSTIGVISAIDVWEKNQSLFLIRNSKFNKL
jgi:hypothetical protein